MSSVFHYKMLKYDARYRINGIPENFNVTYFIIFYMNVIPKPSSSAHSLLQLLAYGDSSRFSVSCVKPMCVDVPGLAGIPSELIFGGLVGS